MKYQITSIYDVVLEKEKKLGLTIMDGNFYPFYLKVNQTLTICTTM